MNAPPTSAPASDRELFTSRIFDFPRERLFSAWTDPDQLAQWWGPKGFTNTFEVCDVKPGGKWRFVMHGPDGTNYKNENEFVEVVKPERIVVRHVSWPHFQMTATFEDLGAKTKLTWHMLFESAADYEKVKSIVVEANEQNFDRLGDVAAKWA